MKTQAAILYELNKPLVLEELEIPQLQRGQVLVRMLYSGICRAQLNEMLGLKGPDAYLPHLLGHEGSGIIEEIDKSVTHVKPGDYVALSWIKGAGIEAPQSFYRQGSRTINAGAVTTFSQHTIASENRLTKLPPEIPADIASIIGCAIATGAGIVMNQLKAKAGQSLVIFGVGGIGASALMAGRMVGCDPIIAVDIFNNKLEFARELGATFTINASKEDVISAIRKLVSGGVDFAIDASGNRTAMESGFAAIHDCGILVIAGNLNRDDKISLHPFELIKGKRIIGSWGGETVPHRDLPNYARAFQEGRLPIGRLITHHLDLEEINTGFEILKNGEAGRVVIKLNDNS